MFIETRHVLLPEFLQSFKSFREANINNWDETFCMLPILHVAALGCGFLHLIPDRECTINLGNVSNQIETKEDGSQLGCLTYIHKITGLKKILTFDTTTNSAGNKQFSFFWQDNKSERISLVYNKNILLNLYINNIYGETAMEVYDIAQIWKLITMANFGLISELDGKMDYIKSVLESAQNDKDIKDFCTNLSKHGLENYPANQDLNYLGRAWALHEFHSPLHFMVTHIHKVLMNYDSELKLCMPEEGNKIAKLVIENGKRTLEAFYINIRTGAERKLKITEIVNDDVGEKDIAITFGNQRIGIEGIEFKMLGNRDWNRLWKFSANVRVNLICERRMDKLDDILSSFYGADTPEKIHFMQTQLYIFTQNLDSRKSGIFMWEQLLSLDPNGFFYEGTFFKILKADFILREGTLRVYEMLRTAWDTDNRRAVHFIAFFTHLALLQCVDVPYLLNVIGSDNTEMITARNYYEINNGKGTLEATYKFSNSGKGEQLIFTEVMQDGTIFASLGKKQVEFFIPDLVKGGEWIRNADNVWHWNKLNKQVKELVASLLSDNIADDSSH